MPTLSKRGAPRFKVNVIHYITSTHGFHDEVVPDHVGLRAPQDEVVPCSDIGAPNDEVVLSDLVSLEHLKMK